MNPKTEKILFYILLFAASISVFVIDFSANATFDSGDGLQHYLIARYSWDHPELFLDLWGKPIFTILSSPFAQFGLKGMYLFQSLCTLGTCVFLYKIAKKLRIKHAWATPVFIFFSPIYFAVINTGLTEILFGCMFMLSLWLIFEKKFILSAIIFSFVPFVRPEAYLILPLITLLFLIRKQFFAIPFLLTSFILFTIIGYFHFHDILWIITNNYKAAENYIGNKGSFYHFIKHYKDIWGAVYSVFMILGIVSVLYLATLMFFKKEKHNFMPELILLILGSFFGCLLLHSLLYSMPGILNNLGMMRYMVVLIPSSAILALKGLDLISIPLLKKYFYIEFTIVFVIIYLIVKTPFQQWFYPFQLNNEQIVVSKTAKWFLSLSGTKNKKVCYLHPFIPIVTGIDPFNNSKTTLLWSLDKNQLDLLPDSTFIIWDSHYAPQEGQLPLNLLFEETNMIALKHFKYFDDKYPFETWIFMKSTSQKQLNYSLIPESVTDIDVPSPLQKTDSTFFNLDSTDFTEKAMLSEKIFFSGQTSLEYNSNREYGPVFTKKINELKNPSKLKMLEVCFKFFPFDSIKDIIPVIEIRDNNKTITWYGKNIDKPIKFNRWNLCSFSQVLSSKDIDEKFTLNFYFWNKGKRKFYVDDLSMFYYSE